MRHLAFGLFLALALALVRCSPTDTDNTNRKPQTLTRSGQYANPPLPLSITVTSTGNAGSGLGKRLLNDFTFPIKKWFPSAFCTGCPDYVDITLVSINAWGKWMTVKIHADTITYDTVLVDSAESGSKKIDSNNATGTDTGKYWDTIIVKCDTSFGESMEVLWSGSKKVRFDGTPLSLASFDTLHIPQGTLYWLFIEAEPVARIKGSVSGLFTFGRDNDTTVTRQKTYYTKTAYAWNAQHNIGGSTDPSVFENGPAEETDIVLQTTDTTQIETKTGLPKTIGTLRIESTCTTTVDDSTSLTVLFDISRVLTFYNGDTINKNQAPGLVPYDKSVFCAHEAFCGSQRVGIAAVFPGLVGKIEGYSAEYVWSQEDPNPDLDSAGPFLPSDSTFGGRGWLTIMYASDGTILGGKMFQDNGSFCPKGSLEVLDLAAQRLEIGLNPAVFIMKGFKRGTVIGDNCYCTSFMPSWTQGDISSSPLRGEIKFTLALVQP